MNENPLGYQNLPRAVRLTEREAQVLAVLVAFPDEDIALERGVAYLGLVPVAPRTVNNLLRLCAISLRMSGLAGGGTEYYTINETGRDLLAAHWGLEPE